MKDIYYLEKTRIGVLGLIFQIRLTFQIDCNLYYLENTLTTVEKC